MKRPIGKIGILIGALLIMLFSVGCVNEKTTTIPDQIDSQTITKNQTTESNTNIMPQKNRLVREAGDMVEFSLSSNEIPLDYMLRQNKTGMTYNATDYTGDPAEAQNITRAGWFAVYERYYEKLDNESRPLNSIYAGLSFYQNMSKMDCQMNSIIKNFRDQNATELKNAVNLGDRSAAFLVNFDDPENPQAGKISAYEYRFYIGNVFANFELTGPDNTINQADADRYAKIIESKMKNACHNCERAPMCPEATK
ncbi:hypothetical protein HY990_00475 [Candidatus Micrarchaeota archaeon]|nr:hypothetical protein [Candidatus Micrarchaeota archaeon]